MTTEWIAGRGATTRRGNAAAAGGSGRRREDLGAAAGTAGRDAAARRGDATAVLESVQPWGRPRGGGGDRVSRHYGPKGRHSGDAQVDAAARRTTGRRRCGPTGRRSGSPMLDRWRGALNSGTIFTGPAEARVTDGPGRSRGVDEADRGGERVIKPIMREVRDAARWRRGGGGVQDEAGDDGRRGTSRTSLSAPAPGLPKQRRRPGSKARATKGAATFELRQPTSLT